MNHLELISIAGKDRTGQLYRRAAYKLNVLTTYNDRYAGYYLVGRLKTLGSAT